MAMPQVGEERQCDCDKAIEREESTTHLHLPCSKVVACGLCTPRTPGCTSTPNSSPPNDSTPPT
jgi:hypothetical protein